MVARPFRSRKPKSSPLWKCFHSHFERFTAVYPRDYQSRYGVLRGLNEVCNHGVRISPSTGPPATETIECGQLAIEPWLDDPMPDYDRGL